MAENKKSFVLYADLIHNIDHLTNEEKGILFKHLLEYVNDLNPVLEDRLILTAWKPIQRQLKRDLIKFEEVKEKRSEAGKRSAELRALKKVGKDLTNPTSVESVQQRSTNPTVNVNDNVNVNVINNSKKEKTKKEKIDGFLNWFNLQKKIHTGTIGKFKGLSSTDVNNLFKLLKNYNYKDFEDAIPKMFANEWAKETNNLTPTHFLRNDNFNKYLNAEIKKEIIGLG